MTLGNIKERFSVQKLWDQHFSHGFNLLFAKKIFRDEHISLVLGGDHGNVNVYKSVVKNKQIVGFEETERVYETKGGSIQALRSVNVTKFSSEDILVGDATGLFTLITNGQILKRRNVVDSKINGIVIDTDAAGNQSIVIGSFDGTLVAVTPYDMLWKCRLSEVLKEDEQVSESVLSITALHVFRMQSATTDASYVMVADSQKRVHFFQNGLLVTTIQIPSVVTSMCSGYFISDNVCPSHINSDSSTTKDLKQTTFSPTKATRISQQEEQVAMATKSGAVFIFSNFEVKPYMNFSYPITQIKRLPASGADDQDGILCCGHFNKLCILQNGELVTSFATLDWIISMELLEQQCNDGFLLVVGCLDRTVKLLKLRKCR